MVYIQFLTLNCLVPGQSIVHCFTVNKRVLCFLRCTSRLNSRSYSLVCKMTIASSTSATHFPFSSSILTQPQCITFLHLTLYLASSSVTLTFCVFSFIILANLFFSSCLLHFQHPLSDISTILPLHMAKHAQHCFSNFVSKLRFPCDTLF